MLINLNCNFRTERTFNQINHWPKTALGLSDTYRLRMLRVLKNGSNTNFIFRLDKDSILDDALIQRSKQLERRLLKDISDLSPKGSLRYDIDEVIYQDWEFKPRLSKAGFEERIAYFQSLENGPLRPISIENIYAVREARRILIPWKQYILNSSKAHDVPPDLVAAILLYNCMIKAKFPSYSLVEGLGMTAWDLGFVDRNKINFEAARNGETGHSMLNFLIGLVPGDFKLQHDFAGNLATWAGATPTIGPMQVRVDQVPGFPEERSVRQNNLLARFPNIKISTMSNRAIGRLLLSSSELGIEAGVASLELTLKKLINDQSNGTIASMPLMPDLRFLHFTNSLYTRYDNIASQLFGPEVFTSVVIRKEFPFHPTIQEITNNLLVDDFGNFNLPLFFIISQESGVFNKSVPAIFVGITNLKELSALYEMANDNTDGDLQKAALRSIEQLAQDPRQDISNRAKEYMRAINISESKTDKGPHINNSNSGTIGKLFVKGSQAEMMAEVGSFLAEQAAYWLVGKTQRSLEPFPIPKPFSDQYWTASKGVNFTTTYTPRTASQSVPQSEATASAAHPKTTADSFFDRIAAAIGHVIIGDIASKQRPAVRTVTQEARVADLAQAASGINAKEAPHQEAPSNSIKVPDRAPFGYRTTYKTVQHPEGLTVIAEAKPAWWHPMYQVLGAFISSADRKPFQRLLATAS
jgi:hypothetical protein